MIFGFQGSATPIMEGIVDLHNHIFFFLVLIFIFVFWMYANIIYRFWWQLFQPSHRLELVPLRHLSHSTVLEVVWTIIPSLILVAIAVPSFALLYAMDEVLEPTLTLKALGHQWYWSYQYSNCLPAPFAPAEHPQLVPASLADNPPVLVDLASLLPTPPPILGFDSYMVDEADLNPGDYRLLEVDEPLVLPAHTHIRLLVTADDVIHSFAMPQLGIKVDAIPGRLNQQGFFLKRLGVFYGQCSELCGVNHGFMPIVIRAVPLGDFVHWYLSKLDSQHSLGLSFPALAF
jgi:cytochrome c oxidase subunit 2